MPGECVRCSGTTTSLTAAMDERWRIMYLLAVMVVMYVAPVRSLEYSITTTWNGGAVDHAPVNLSLTSSPDQQHLLLSVSAPFFDDPPSPPGPPGQPFYGLWDYEVVEAFFLNDADQYLEVELCPWGQHIVLLLSGQRITVRHSLQLELSTQRGDGVWSGTAAIPVTYLPEKVTKFNAYAIHGSDEARVYEALYPALSTASSPDFHALQYFQPIDLSGLLPSQATDPMSQLWSDALLGLFRYDIATTWDDLPLSPPLVQITLQGFEAGVEMNVTAPFYNDPAPPGPPGEPYYGLWDYEVVEMFFLNKNDEYLEVELGPWGQHLLLLLQGERNAIKHSLPLDYIVTEKTDPVGGAPGQWKGSAMIPPGYFPPNVTLMNAYAIHGVGEARQYQALYPAPNNDPNYPNADFHRLDLFRAIDFEFQVKDNKDYSQVWLDAMGSGASTPAQLVTKDAGEMTTIGPLHSIQTITQEPSDTLAPESVNADPEATATPEPKDSAPEITIPPEPADNTPAVAFSSGPRESVPEIPLPPKPEDSAPETTTLPELRESIPETTFPSKLEDSALGPITYPEPVQRESVPEIPLPPKPEAGDPETTTTPPETLYRENVPEITLPPEPDSNPENITTLPELVHRESVPEVPLPPKPEATDPEITTLAPEPLHRESVPEIPLPPKPDATDSEIITLAPEPVHRESVPEVPLPPRPENSDPEPTTFSPEPVTTFISRSDNTLTPEPAETLPPDSTDTVGQNDDEAAPQDPTTLPPTTPAPTTLPEPLEASTPTLSPGSTRTAGRRRPRPQRVNHNNNQPVSFAQQNLPVRSRGRPVPHPLRVRPNRRVGEHGLPQHGLPIQGGLHPEDFLVHLGQHLLSQHQGLEFLPPRGQAFRGQHKQQQQFFPRDQQFQPPRGQGSQPPRDQHFQTPRDQQFQPPVSQPIQSPKDHVFQPPKDEPIQLPKDQQLQPPRDQVFQSPMDQQFQPPVSQPIQPPKDQVFQPPVDQQFQPPVSQPIQPPKDQVFQSPKDQEFQAPEDRQSQPSDQPPSAPQQEVQEQLQHHPPSGGQQQHHFPPSRGGDASLGRAGEEEVGLQEVEEVIASLTEGSPALPPPHPLCFTPGLVPDEHRCWVFHECELLDGQWQVYSWKCIRGHVFDPFNVACVPGRCRRRRRG